MEVIKMTAQQQNDLLKTIIEHANDDIYEPLYRD